MERHWTEESTESFIQRITFDFITQIQKRLESLPLSQAELAEKLHLSEGAVSQSLNGPRNLTLKTIVRYARAVGIKVALVAYDDRDPDNSRGPVNSDIFRICWENAGRPQAFNHVQEIPHSVAENGDATLIQRKGYWIRQSNKSVSPSTRSGHRLGEIKLEAVSEALKTKQLIRSATGNLRLAG
jgi:transcriptional regulator with XRE-family HTH domain